MNKKYLFRTALCALTAIVGACSSNDFVEQQTTDKLITMTALDFKYEDGSRTSIDITSGGGSFTWAEYDTVGIFPNKGHQVDFPMVNGAGTKTAFFNGGGWALKPSSTYTAYYPYCFYNRDSKAIPIGWEGQIQVGNASTTHLGKYDYMAAVASTPSEGCVNFEFQHLGCLVQLTLTLPKEKSISIVRLSALGNPFITHGTVDLTADTLSIKPITTSSSISIKLNNVSVSTDTNTVTVYLMIAPTDLNGQDIEVYAGGYTTTISGEKFVAGFAYPFSVTFKEPIYPDELWIDLGLPSGKLWASHNVGATKPEEYGDYFAWGEIKPKYTYTNENSLTIYKPWGSIAGDAEYDVATASWGAPTRMPTKIEIQELVDNTTQEWTTLNGVNGYRVTSKKNSNSIFLPAAGYRNTSLNSVEENGNYWSSTPFETITSDMFYTVAAYSLYFNSSNFYLDCLWRSKGYSVRPVRD